MDFGLDDAGFDLYAPQIGAGLGRSYARAIIATLVVMTVQAFSISLQATEATFAQTEQDIASLLLKVDKIKVSKRYQEAIPLLEQAILYLEKALGPNDKFIGAELNALADLYTRSGQYGEAEPLYKRSLSIS